MYFFFSLLIFYHRCKFAEEWMTDFEAFSDVLDADRAEAYMGSFNRSLALVMDEFYK